MDMTSLDLRFHSEFGSIRVIRGQPKSISGGERMRPLTPRIF
jgi:hypothetical protein